MVEPIFRGDTPFSRGGKFKENPKFAKTASKGLSVGATVCELTKFQEGVELPLQESALLHGSLPEGRFLSMACVGKVRKEIKPASGTLKGR